MNILVGTEVDPYRSDTVAVRLRYELAYAGSWLLMGLTLAKDGVAGLAAGHQREPQHRPSPVPGPSSGGSITR